MALIYPWLNQGFFFSLKGNKSQRSRLREAGFCMHRIILAIHVFLLVQNFSPVAGRIHGDKGRVGRLKPLEKDTGAQPRVLGLQKQCKRERVSPWAWTVSTPSMRGMRSTSVKATFGLFAPLLDDKMIPADKFLEGLSCRLGWVPVKLQGNVIPDEGEGPERKPAFIAIVDHNTGGGGPDSSSGEFLHGAPILQTKLHQFTLAGKTQRKGEGNGDIGMGGGTLPCGGW